MAELGTSAVSRTFSCIINMPTTVSPSSARIYNDYSDAQVREDTHQWVPKQPGDARSPCPALNTLANHGYL